MRSHVLILLGFLVCESFCFYWFYLWFSSFDYDVSRCQSPCFFLAWRLLSFMDMSVFFINLVSFQLLFLWRFFCPFLLFWSFHCEYVGTVNGVPYYSEVLLIFLPPFFPLYSLGYVTFINLVSSSLINYFASLNTRLNTLLNFSFQLL